jgi:hypothetical protein
MNILVPISLGELIDKITILKIKLNKMTDEKKIANVKKEYISLVDVLNNTTGNNLDEKHELFKKLYKINLEFWEYHDWQREKWRSLIDQNLIDIELFKKNREEHILNDKRAEIKKQINILFESDIVEEKQFISYNI